MSNLSPDQFHSFDVTVSSHDDLKKGIVAKKVHGSQHAHHRVVISADYSPEEAQIVAAQMAHVTSGNR